MSKTPLTDALVSELASGTAAEVLQRNWVTPLMNHARDLECKLAEVCQDAERYRWAKENLFIGYVNDDVCTTMDDTDIDAVLKEGK